MDTWVIVFLFVGVHVSCALAYDDGSGYSAFEDDEDSYARRYKGTPWCAPVKVKNGHVSCQTPRGEYYKNVMGTRCKIGCKKGYEVVGHPEIICMANKRWSGNYACREIRCPKLTMPANGGYKCSDGSYFNSRCEFFCSPGYQLKGDRMVMCMSNKAWTGRHTSCVDVEPPTIKCPSVKEKTAEPGKLTARVHWDTPEGRDTADGTLTDVLLKGRSPGSDFPEGDHRIQYTVYDRAGNKGTCRFSVKVRAMNINVGVRTAASFLDQFYEKRRLIFLSAPTAAHHHYRTQMEILQQAQCGIDLRHVSIVELVGVYPAQIGRIGHRLIHPGLALQLRLLLQISHNSYNMVLVDKHGTDKERYTFPVTAAELFTLIDSFPLRQEEMKLQQEAGQTCS
ncbi:sushi repeat-containing protein SRPX isoform X3 [Lepisosteus oculatus]|uniref:sushi repeat-containing protein SRPX isoform X3 n=1 Tax=Lepisosteus oculatus TaxID=7918 RepID=UPI0007401455|nr:PREDICTED: sushi repeat-containing protein SRPX isoform X3 [Lepisosteus oculatus]